MRFLKVSVVCLLFYCVPSGIAQAPAPEAGVDPEIAETVLLLQAALDLTPPQAEKIRQLAQTRRNELESIETQAGPKVQRLMILLDDPKSDPATVGKLSLELREIRKEVLSKQAETEKQLISLLNPAQQQTVQSLGRSVGIFVGLKKIGLIDPDLSDGIFMNGMKATAATDATQR